VDLSAGTSKVRVVVECFPEVVDGFMARLGTSVEENANLGLSKK
jgi:hypothetical protein